MKDFQKYLKTSFNEFYQSLTRVMISQSLEEKRLICFNLQNLIFISISPLGQQDLKSKYQACPTLDVNDCNDNDVDVDDNDNDTNYVDVINTAYISCQP